MYCIVEVENHEDRCIENIIGPFTSIEFARVESRRLTDSPNNYWCDGTKKSRFSVHTLKDIKDYK